jgi:alpha-L-fucosidase
MKKAIPGTCLAMSMVIALAAVLTALAAVATPGPGPIDIEDARPDAAPQAQAGADRTAWFRDAKFGLFIHWGVYSMIGREEWARTLLQIPRDEYARLAKDFNPVHFDPGEWVALAKRAGVKYIVITSKHHDGFAIYDSAASDYDIMGAKYGRDILAMLAESCRKAGLPLGFYYSIMDWHHPDYLPRRAWESDRSAKGADFGRYMDFAVAQVTELVETYDPAVMWFDGEWEHSNEEQRAFEIERILFGLKPALLINDRLFRREPGHGDFGTPENFVPATGVRNPDGSPRLWEACSTMNWNGWGYNRYETEFRSASQLIRQLVEIVSKGGNLLLNIGPQPDGRIQPEFVARLERIGEWLAANGEAVYGTTASVFERLPFFGRVTVKGRTLYVHVMGWPQDGKIVLPGLQDGRPEGLPAGRPGQGPPLPAGGRGHRRQSPGAGPRPRRGRRRRRAQGRARGRPLRDPPGPPGPHRAARLSRRPAVRDGPAGLPRPLLPHDHDRQLAERQRLPGLGVHDGQGRPLRGPGLLRQHVGRTGLVRSRDRRRHDPRPHRKLAERLLPQEPFRWGRSRWPRASTP